MKRLWPILLLAVALDAHAGQRARYGGELRVVAPALPASLDPAECSAPTDVAVARLLFATLFTLGPDGALSADLAAAVPEPEAAGKLFRIRLKSGLRHHDGTLLTAQDAAASLGRLADPAAGSQFAALTLPLVGAGDGGRISGLSATSETDLQASLAFPYPDWLKALAHPATAPLPGGKLAAQKPVGAGPLLLATAPGATELRLQAFADCAQGRPFVDAVRVSTGDSRAASRALALGEADVVLGAADKKAAEGPALFATYLALNPVRLGAQAATIRQAIEASGDPVDLARFFVRGAVPMAGLLPPSLDPSPPAMPRPARPSVALGQQLVLLSDASADDQRAVGERLLVKLHDYGVAVQHKRVARDEYRQALAQGGYDLALVAFAALPEPGLALAQLVQFAQGRDAARELLRQVGAGADPAARRATALALAAQLKGRLPLLPLYAQAPRAVFRPGVAPVGFDGCGAPSLADAWFLEPRPR